MALSANAMAYGAVGVALVVLFAIGTPAQRGRDFALQPPPAAAQAPAAVTAPLPTVASAAGITLRSVDLTFPTTGRVYPGGAPADPLNANCVACHSPGMVLNQPALTRADWESEVSKMRSVYKAPVVAEDVPAIVAYLAALRPGG